MAPLPDLVAVRANAVTSSRAIVLTGVKGTTTIHQASSRTISAFTSLPKSAGNPNPKVVIHLIVIGVVVGFTIVVICLLLLCCCQNISRKAKKKIPKIVFVHLGRRSNPARNLQPAMCNLDVHPDTLSRSVSPLRPLEPPRNPLGEASGDKAIELNEVSKDHPEVAKEESDAEYWRAYKERELKRRGSPETEKIRKAIEMARVRDHVEWVAYRRSLSESSRLAPTEEHVRSEGSGTSNRVRYSLNHADLYGPSTGTLWEPEAVADVAHGAAHVYAGTNREGLNAESLDSPPAYTKTV